MWCDRHRAQVRLVPDLADSLSQRQFTELLCTHRSMSRFKFGVAAVKGPLESLPMTRVSVDGGSLLKHVVAAQLQLTAEEAVEKISRLEVFTSYDFKGKAILTTADLEETMSSFRDDGFRAVKLCLRSDPGAPARTHRAVATFLSRWPCKLEAANEEPWSALVVEVMLQLQAYAVAYLAKRQCIHLSCGEPIDSSSTKRHCTRCQDQEAELTEYEIQQHE